MFKSMTGFGSASFEDDQLAISVEIRTLNSKFCDISFKLPKYLANRELELRSLISKKLERGKIHCLIDFERKNTAAMQMQINEDLFLKYYTQMNQLAVKVNADTQNLFQLVLQAPEVMHIDSREDSGEDWEKLVSVLNDAMNEVDNFRSSEGKTLKKQLAEYLANIETLLNEIITRDPERVENVKTRLKNNVFSVIKPEDVDENRFEQELIYYLEKLDISEEKVRLKSHLDYFLESLENDEMVGKKLGFISQEIGREINTIGSKVNEASMQRLVVQMKDELEKIKEQSMNVL
jgi:uncharacterized protein (TIGR00255 family)